MTKTKDIEITRCDVYEGGVDIDIEATVRTADFDLHYRIEFVGGRPACTGLDIRGRAGRPEVTSARIRAIKVQKDVLDILEEALGELQVAMQGELVDDKRTATRVEQVAAIHQQARMLGQPPTKAVREHFGVSQATAGRWVAEARGLGLINDEEK